MVEQMDIWHKIGTIFCIENLGVILFFFFNAFIVISVLGLYGGILAAIIIYSVTTLISLSFIGEELMCLQIGAKPIQRKDMQLKILPLQAIICEMAGIHRKIKVKVIDSDEINAYTIGRRTIVVTRGLLTLPDKTVLAVLAHEAGHLVYGHSAIYLVIGGGNVFITTGIWIVKLFCMLMSSLVTAISIYLHHRWLALIAAVIGLISTALLHTWTRFSSVFLYWSMRKNEFVADRFAFRLGFGYELAEALDHYIPHQESTSFFKALFWTHPRNDERIAALQKLGVPYSSF